MVNDEFFDDAIFPIFVNYFLTWFLKITGKFEKLLWKLDICSDLAVSAAGRHGDVRCVRRWNTYVVDGHDIDALCKVLYEATMVKGKPTCILAKTLKGKGLAGEQRSQGPQGLGR